MEKIAIYGGSFDPPHKGHKLLACNLAEICGADKVIIIPTALSPFKESSGATAQERYEMCRSIHAEANAIISASREEMIGSTLYMACIDAKTGELASGTSSCAMCKRQVINAGIEKVVIRDTEDTYRIIEVSDWVTDDDSLTGQFGY